LTREGNPDIQLALFYDYQNNLPHYPAWQVECMDARVFLIQMGRLMLVIYLSSW